MNEKNDSKSVKSNGKTGNRTKKTQSYNKTSKKTNAPAKKTNTKSSSNTKRTYTKNIHPKKPIRVIPLGGLGEIGKNITLYEYDGDMILVDCGMSFPDEETPGIDIVIPDFTYVLENKDKIKGMVVTHGHEDHIGAIPYLLMNFN